MMKKMETMALLILLGTAILMFFAAEAVKMLRHGIVVDWEAVIATFFFSFPAWDQKKKRIEKGVMQYFFSRLTAIGDYGDPCSVSLASSAPRGVQKKRWGQGLGRLWFLVVACQLTDCWLPVRTSLSSPLITDKTGTLCLPKGLRRTKLCYQKLCYFRLQDYINEATAGWVDSALVTELSS